MARPLPGDFITTRCRRCDDVTGHTIMLVLEGVVAKVECRACGSVHKYYSTASAKKTLSSSSSIKHVRAGLGRDAATTVGAKASPRRTRVSASQKIESAWQEAMVRHSADRPIPYSMETPVSKGMFIEHSKFGRGEIINVIKPDRAEILFQEGVKLLVCCVE